MLVALVLLAVLGGSVGWLVGGRVLDARARAGGPSGSSPGTVPTSDPGASPAGGPRCPTHTQDLAAAAGAAGDLAEVLYIRTAAAQVWICRDSAGTLFYQGSRAGVDAEMVEGKNALFLTDVVAQDDGYVATNRVDQRVTTYTVSAAELVQRSGTGDPDRAAVIAHRP
jgi:hypothetical protein